MRKNLQFHLSTIEICDQTYINFLFKVIFLLFLEESLGLFFLPISVG